MGAREAGDPALAALLLLPAALLLLPFAPGPLRGVFDAVEATGAGAALLAALPAAALTAWRALRAPAAIPLLLPALWLVAALAAWTVPGTDRFGRDAALAIVSTGSVLAIGAAGLGAPGRRWLLRGLVAISLLSLLPALLGPAGAGWGGVVGNTGELSGAALPGALVGAGLFARGRGAWVLLGLAAALAFALHALLAPVLAGSLTLAVVAGGTGLLLRRTGPAGVRLLALGGLGLVALGLVGFGALGSRGDGAGPRSAPPLEVLGEPAPQPGAAGDLGGIGVRASIWRASLGLVREHPLLGVGPGQFAAAFPPHRDPAEIERSTGRMRSVETEVEHPHSDLVLAFAELGLVGGLVWLALLLAVLRRALADLGAPDADRAVAALGALAVVFGSLFNAHLLANPPASVAAFPLVGLVLAAGGAPTRRSLAARLAPALAFAVLCASVGPARSLVAHGRALGRLGSIEQPSLANLELAVAEALEARPDSVVARLLRAHMAPVVGVSERAAIERTRAVLELRPHHVGSWIDLGARLATAGAPAGAPAADGRGPAADPEGARQAFERALELDPQHPIALANLSRLELFEGNSERGVELLDRLVAAGRLDPTRGLRLGADLLLHGYGGEGEAVLAQVDARFAGLTGERAQALALEFERRSQPHLAEALKAHAHRLWGWEQAGGGDFTSARRSLFQALRASREAVEGGAPRLRLEYAAALVLSGKGEEAPAWVEGSGAEAGDWAALPGWARSALLYAGLGG